MKNFNKKRSYFDDINIDIDKLASECLEDAFTLRDLRQRKLFLEGEVDSYSVSDLVRNIMQYNADDKNDAIPPEERKPILLYINSPGGDVAAGYALIDAIECSKTPVYTVNTGMSCSMAFLITLAGHKRFSYPNVRLLLHDGSSFIYDSSNKMMDRMKFEERSEAKIKEFVLNHSKISEETYDANARVEWWMFAEEAQELGFIDYVVGKDCDIDEVV